MTLRRAFHSMRLSAGRALLRLDPEIVAAGAHLRCGPQRFELSALAQGTKDDTTHALAVPLWRGPTPPALQENRPDGSALPRSAECWFDAMPDWSLTGSETLQIGLRDPAQPRRISFAARCELPPLSGPLQIEALCAAHHADVDLVVTAHLPDGQEVVQTVPLDPGCTGGRDANGYQPIRLSLPDAARGLSLELAFDYRASPREADAGKPPYLFLAAAQVVRPDPVHPLLWPHILTGEAAGGALFVADGVGCPPGRPEALSLALGRERLPLLPACSPGIALHADQGHSIVLEASQHVTGLLFIDGAPDRAVHLSPGRTALRWPARVARGALVTAALKDLSGSQVLWQGAFLVPRMMTDMETMAKDSRRPFPGDLPHAARCRYDAVRAHLAGPLTDKDRANLLTALDGVDTPNGPAQVHALTLPTSEQPEVSVIIPAHNNVAATYACLCALVLARCATPFETILVDDGSTDDTRHLETSVTGLRVVRHTHPQRFVHACNAGVAAARGRYVALLNNDTEPTTGWLDHLVDAFERFGNVGLVGAKLLYPDGTLQDAGGLVWETGTPWNTGRDENPYDPRFCYARQVDYLSGAALLLPRALWDAVGGFSEEFAPMYYEDTDLAFKIRAAGYKTYVIPSAVVYHHEGKTSGTDTSQGFKRYQTRNAPKFVDKWRAEFAGLGAEGIAPDLHKDRGITGRVLFIDYATPKEDRDAGSYAAWREIELVQSLGYKVTFLPQNLAHMGAYTDALERAGVETLYAPFTLSLEEALSTRGPEFDAVYITRYHVAQAALPLVRAWAPQAKVILNNADLHFLREMRVALNSGDAAQMTEVEEIRQQELAMMEAADLVLSYSDVEQQVILSHTQGRARVMTCPWVVTPPAEIPGLAGRTGLSFLGSFKHFPNVEGVDWFCRTVMPRVAAQTGALSIYGAALPPEIRALQSDRILPVGFIKDVAQAYDTHRIFVAPLLSGAGIKGKVISALAHGIPCVLSPVAAEGIGLTSGQDCLICETPEAWSGAIAQLATDDQLWTQMSRAARTLAKLRFSFATGRGMMAEAFDAVGLATTPP